MWKTSVDNEKILIKIAIKFTENHVLYGEAMKNVVEQWPRTMTHNLTNPSLNKRAFVGHCAACYYFYLPEYITRIAWGFLTEQQRILANEKADYAIGFWQNRFISSEQKTVKFQEIKNQRSKILNYIETWESRCYNTGVSDQIPKEIFELAPSYQRICMAILKNDYPLKSLGFIPETSKYYDQLKKIEIEARNSLPLPRQ